MLHTIENEQLICTIESVGAEIRSLIDKTTGKEYIWQIDQSVWVGSSPVLFPAIGKIKEDKVIFDGKEYAMPKHGIVRNNDQLDFVQHSQSACSYTLVSSEETLKQYPFKFAFTIEYALVENRLIMNFKVENRDTVPMAFACGGHTAYACPLGEDTQLSDYVVEFPMPIDLQTNTLGPSGLMSYDKRKVASNGNLLTLTDILFNEDALVFSDIEYDWVRLRKKNEDKGVIVRFSGYPNLALWSKPGADYLCIEPWLGLPDPEEESVDISKKSTFKSIDPATEFSIAIETEIE